MARIISSCFRVDEEDESCASSSYSSSSSASSSSRRRTTQNGSSLTYLYQTSQVGIISVSWTHILHAGIRLSLTFDHHQRHERHSRSHSCTVMIKPWSLPWKKKGSKQVVASEEREAEVIWDLSKAKFHSSTPEPSQGYFLAVIVGNQITLLLGDLPEIAYRRIQATEMATNTTNTAAILVCKREHVMGRQVYSSWVRFGEKEVSHLMVMELGFGSQEEEDPYLVLTVDGQKVMEVKRLQWKFRGNERMIVDGRGVEVYWDVHDCLFQSNNNIHAPALFMFLPHNPSPLQH